ncbi:MAG: hypothetical protein ABFD61_06820 [Chloroherpetonaceae bacterium]
MTNKIRTIAFLILFIITNLSFSFSQFRVIKFETIQTFQTNEARQGVAVDSNYFYTINSNSIGKYNKKNGDLISEWKDTTNSIIHFDGGVIVNQKLYCAHSNYPEVPMTSSIEIFNKENLEHISSHSFGIKYGSCTWADYYNDYWWVCFANYDKFEPVINKDNSWTVLIKFDENWNEIESWTFPKKVLQEFKPMSCSGGSWGPDGYLYVTGHDSAKVYVLQLPRMGSVLELVKTMNVGFKGQGIAWDRFDKNCFYGIIKNENVVIKSKLN